MKTVVDKLFENIIVTDDDSCWDFVGGRNGNGYGVISISKHEQVGAHRVSYQHFYGPIPDGLFVLHKCDNPSCCNPTHLFLGTLQDNKDDEVLKMRHVHGERVGNHLLSENDVTEIRSRLSEGVSVSALSWQYGVSRQSIYNIKHNLTWSHLW